MAADMTAAAETTTLVSAVYRQYAWLMDGKPEALGGQLLLVAETGSHAYPDADALVRAANIAGAASLLLNGDSTAARERVRSGVCDFLVTNLDEGLRILKNELRRRQAAAVCLLAEPSQVLKECAQRGVQPECLAIAATPLSHAGVDNATPCRLLTARGARSVPVSLDTRADLSYSDPSWQITSWTIPPKGIRLLPALDKLALGALPSSEEESVARRRWLTRAPQYLGRSHARTHTVPMQRSEADLLVYAVTAGMREGRLPPGIQVCHGVDELLPHGVSTV